jgi:Tol biopolymer transport system component
MAYDPSWSPTAERITFVTDDTGSDEIWVINRDGSGALQLTRNSWEWDKHPSWSPDGSKIVFWSNRTGNRGIWVMDADGNNLHSLSRTGFNDWDPVWIKYTDPVR